MSFDADVLNSTTDELNETPNLSSTNNEINETQSTQKSSPNNSKEVLKENEIDKEKDKDKEMNDEKSHADKEHDTCKVNSRSKQAFIVIDCVLATYIFPYFGRFFLSIFNPKQKFKNTH